MLQNTLKIRNGIIFCILLLAIYFASIRWCLKARLEQEQSPIVIQFQTPFLEHGDEETFHIEDVLQNSFLDNLVNGPMLSKEHVKQHQNEDIVFFNRIPKTGSEMIVLLLQWLQKQNNFRHYRLKNTLSRHLSLNEQLDLAADMGEIINNSKERTITFDRHVHFTNFTNLGLKMPVFINMVRDPVEKITSRYYYARVTPRPGGYTPPNSEPPKKRSSTFFSLEDCVKARSKECTFIDGELYDLTIPYFCGHQNYCRELNNVAALLTAKRNAEQWFSAIGVLEQLNETLTVFEAVLPKIFKGVSDLYFQELQALHFNKNRQKPSDVPEWVTDQIRHNLSMEYDFYYFVKQKLHKEYSSILNSKS